MVFCYNHFFWLIDLLVQIKSLKMTVLYLRWKKKKPHLYLAKCQIKWLYFIYDNIPIVSTFFPEIKTEAQDYWVGENREKRIKKQQGGK